MRVKRAALHVKEELIQVIKTVWNELDDGPLSQLISRFPKRLEVVIRARGWSISRYLSSHRSEPTAEDVSANQDIRPLGPAEDTAILEWVNRVWNRWKRIAEILSTQFGPCERMEIKHRVKWLMDCQAKEAATELTPGTSDRQESSFTPEEFFVGPPFQLVMHGDHFREE
jgi:hypothetical protein